VLVFSLVSLDTVRLGSKCW